MGIKIKFMGSSHNHYLKAGDTFGGRLSEPLQKDVVFNRKNGWVVDSEQAGLSDDAVSVLLTDSAFKDVSGYEVVPVNDHQKIFLGLKDGVTVQAVKETAINLDELPVENLTTTVELEIDTHSDEEEVLYSKDKSSKKDK